MIGLIKCWIESCIICYFVFHDKLGFVLPKAERGEPFSAPLNVSFHMILTSFCNT